MARTHLLPLLPGEVSGGVRDERAREGARKRAMEGAMEGARAGARYRGLALPEVGVQRLAEQSSISPANARFSSVNFSVPQIMHVDIFSFGFVRMGYPGKYTLQLKTVTHLIS